MYVIIDTEKCTGCEECLSSCPFDAIVIEEGKAFINENCQVCMACISACPEGAISEIEREEPVEFDIQKFKGVWVFAEQREGKVASVAYELLGVGRRISDELTTELSAVLFGASESEAQELIRWGADRVYLSVDPIFEKFNDEPYSQLFIRLIKKHKPEIV
ncbi:MAG: 4Fe-4S binding protein, partial [Nitrospirae bacterium]|nr:4Fe-4S binding protein [Nitrospirota bacterium]